MTEAEGWRCEVCKARGIALKAYWEHLRSHPLGELAEVVEPGLGWPKQAVHATWQAKAATTATTK